jgi:branched-chain amino acid transport system ATP-binding protein
VSAALANPAPAAAGPPLLELERITTGYGDVPVTRNVSMRFPTGLMTAIIGSNGAGKSTIIKAAAGLLPAWSGRVLASGTDVTREAAHLRLKRGIAYVPQGRIVIPEMSVRDNLELGAHILGGARGRINAAIDRLIVLFPVLGRRIGQQAGTMSGGEQQMLAIARALITEPTTIVLDEPSLGLSPKLVDVVFEKLTELCATGLTIVMVEQKASRALAVAHYGYVMHSGQVAYEGEAGAMLQNDNVKRLFLGEIPEDLRLLEDG